MSTEANKALVRRYFEDLANHADLSVAADIITPEHVADVQHLIRMLHTAFPDFHVTIEEQIAEGALVATRFTASGTHRGEWHSPLGTIAPTGKRFSQMGIRIFRIANGKLVEAWGGADMLSQLQQLGVVPPPSNTST
jgi:predicted ester cyclase